MGYTRVYFWAGSFYGYPHPTALLLYRDGRQIQLNEVEEGEFALQGTSDGWLALSPDTHDGDNQQTLYAYHVNGDQISREEISVFPASITILYIELDMNPDMAMTFEKVPLPISNTETPLN